jgi:DNA repair exonuclease SbcCD ATPase subunit
VKITHLVAENYKRLQAVEVTPDGHLIDISGRNAQGKSSLLDAIWAALAGKDAIAKAPIRKGAENARIQLTLGDGTKVALVVKRTFAKKEDGTYTTSVVVESADGARYGSPQKVLDGLLGALSFDPLAFTRMDPKAQLRELRDLVPGVDFDAIDAANKEDYELRTDVGRQGRVLRAQLDALTIPGDPRHERVDESALVAELEAAGEHNALIERRRSNRAEAERNAKSERLGADRCEARIRELRREIETLESDMQNHLRSAEAIERKLKEAEELPLPVETSAIRARIDAARKTNLVVSEREAAIKNRAALEESIKTLDASWEAYTARMAKREAEKAQAIAAAKLPVEGLTFTSDEILLDGLPFEQASDAEKLRASVAIAAAKNPKLRVIRIRDGSLLDSDGVRALAQFAEEHDLQVWREVVADDAKTGIVIEDGRIAHEEALREADVA